MSKQASHTVTLEQDYARQRERENGAWISSDVLLTIGFDLCRAYLDA